MRNWRGQCKDWSLQPGDRDYDIQQRIIAAVSPRDPKRHRMVTCGEPGYTGHPEWCRHPACRVCLARERKTRVKAARARFAGLERDALFSGTFLLQATDRLEATSAKLKEFKVGLRNRIEYQRRRDARWQAVCVMATQEVALFHDNDLVRLPAETQRVLRDVGFAEGDCGGPVWLVHVHVLVHIGEVEADEVRAVLADLLPGHRRVMLHRMHERGVLAEQVRNVVSYPHKPVLRRRDPDADGGWSDFDDEELALYVAWAGTPEGRFPQRRFWIGPARAWSRQRDEAASEPTNLPVPEHDPAAAGQPLGYSFRISVCPSGTGPASTIARQAVPNRRARRYPKATQGEQQPAAVATRARDPPA